MIKTVLLFDIDGTLLLTGGAGQIAIDQAFEELFGVADAWGNCHPDGKTDAIIFQEIAQEALGRDLSAQELKDFIQAYTDRFPQALLDSSNFRLMPGVVQLLDKLSAMPELLLGVATGNVQDTSWMKLKHAKLDHYFSFGGFGCDSSVRAEIIAAAMQRAGDKGAKAVSPNQYYIIGDTPKDIACAKANDAKCIAVATGSYALDELNTHQPEHVLIDLTDHTNFLDIIGVEAK
ncbi:MAG: phosphoglycolate phosphatase [Candidatus Omnitrophota bacterium]|jgi:phosphoglycolate phosphatase